MFMEMVSTTFFCNSSSFCFSLLPTSLDENELSRGVKLSGISLFSMDIISSFLKGSSWMEAPMLSSLGRACQDPTLPRIYEQYRD
jgi:hypothetical protein